MSLATRCTACGTVFRVVQDQLKVSEGWVRCGRCDQVFNAIEGLFDLERDAPPDWTPPPAPPQPPAASITSAYQPPVEPPAEEDDVFQLSDEDRIHSRFFQPEQDDVAQTPAQTVAERDRVDFADASFNEALLAEVETPSTERPPLEPEPVAPPSKRRGKPGTPQQPPAFLREAKRKARWRSPRMRISLSFLSLLLAAVLVGQLALHFRDLTATRWPSTRPWLVAACQSLGCKVGLPRRIDDVAVESSSLSPANGGAAYRLTVVLRNRGSLPLALPSVELSLTDSDGQLVSRRVLSPLDFRADPRIAAGTESTLQLVFTADGPRVTGYTVEIFYP